MCNYIEYPLCNYKRAWYCGIKSADLEDNLNFLSINRFDSVVVKVQYESERNAVGVFLLFLVLNFD